MVMVESRTDGFVPHRIELKQLFPQEKSVVLANSDSGRYSPIDARGVCACSLYRPATQTPIGVRRRI
jgi:hypothetical protein